MWSDIMKSCTFFGHRDAPESIRYDLKQVLIELIENKGVTVFYLVTYVKNTWGGAYKFKERPEKKNKKVINLYKE